MQQTTDNAKGTVMFWHKCCFFSYELQNWKAFWILIYNCYTTVILHGLKLSLRPLQYGAVYACLGKLPFLNYCMSMMFSKQLTVIFLSGFHLIAHEILACWLKSEIIFILYMAVHSMPELIGCCISYTVLCLVSVRLLFKETLDRCYHMESRNG